MLTPARRPSCGPKTQAYDAAVRSRARIVVLALLCGLAPALGCRRGVRSDEELRAARQATALAWVNATVAGDAAKLRLLTTDPFVFRSVGADRACEGRISGKAAFDQWLGCVRAKEHLQGLSETFALFRQAPPRSPERAEFEKYLPHVVDADEAWSRFVGADERARARDAFAAISREAARDGEWVMVTASWLYTSLVVRLQVAGPATAPHVHAVLVDVTRTSD